MHSLATNDGVIELQTTPYAHQRKELIEHWSDEARALPWSMRTGKSMVVVISAAALWQRSLLDAVIVVAPSRVHHAWAKHEFPKHCPAPFFAHSWSCNKDSTQREQRRLKAFTKAHKTTAPLAVLAINKEALLVPRVWNYLKKFAASHPGMLIVDESHWYGSPGSKGTKRIRALASRCPYRRILSGTMVGNSPGRVYSQFQILQKGALGYDTSAEFLQAHGSFVFDGRHWVQDKKKWRDKEVLRERMAKWGRPVMRSDCEDLPDVVTSRQYHELTNAIWDDYAAAMVEAQETDPPNFTLARRTSMIGKEEILFEILPELLDTGPVIIWAPFTNVVDDVAQTLRKSKFPAATHHGKLSQKARARALESIKRAGGILVSTPDSLQEGMDLSWARTIIWYAPPWNSITFEQARERCTKVGGKDTVEILLITKDTIEEGMYKSLERKQNVADWLGGTGLRDWMKENEH